MDLDDIRLFVKVAERKSFVKAAEDLRLQTSLLSRRIARLEASLGVRLLQRTTRSVSLTEEGERFLFDSAKGIDQLKSAVDSLNSLHGIPRGKVKISSPIEIGQLIIETVMPGFFKKYPEIIVDWDFLSSSRSIVESGVDLVIRAEKPEELTTTSKKLGRVALQLYRGPDFFVSLPKTPTLEHLENLPWLIYHRGPLDSPRAKIKFFLDGVECEIIPKNIRFRTNSLVSIRHLIQQGLGVGFLPLPIAGPEVALGKLVPLLPKSVRQPGVDFYATYPSRQYLSPKTRALIDWLSERFPTNLT
jgi:DNA-binding transcriptional LysR family regulator